MSLSRVTPFALAATWAAAAVRVMRGSLVRQISWNWFSAAADIIVGFISAPLLISRLGDAGYGIWIVIGALTGYFALMDLGIRGALGRQLAFHAAQEDWERARSTLASATIVLAGAGAVIALLSISVLPVAVQALLPVDGIQRQNLHDATRLAGLTLALSFPLQAFDAVLWSASRFDLLARVDTASAVLRLGLVWILVWGPGGLTRLAMVMLLVAVGTGAAKAAGAFIVVRPLRQTRWRVARESLRELTGYGSWTFVMSAGRLALSQSIPAMVGGMLGPAAVTQFSIARRRQDYSHRIVWTATGVLVPAVTRLHAQTRLDEQRRLMISASLWCAAAAVYFLVLFTVAARAIVHAWVGNGYLVSARCLIILTAGEFIMMTQSATGGFLLAQAKHRGVAIVVVVEALIGIGVSVVFARQFGLLAVCAGLAAAQVITGIAVLWLGCRAVHMTVWEWVRASLLPIMVRAALPAIAFGGLFWLFPPTTRYTTLAAILVFTCAYALSVAPALGIRPTVPGSAAENG